MKLFRTLNLKRIREHIKTGGTSMRRRFTAYIISAIAMVLSLILLLLNIFGILNPTNPQVMDRLDTQLSSYVSLVELDYDKVAAYAISFAEQLEQSIQNYLTTNNLAFDDLQNNSDYLNDLQGILYDILYLNMQITPSSGAFYILNTTVNTSSDVSRYNGLYLKYINLYSENAVNNKISLYRGSVTTGKECNLTFHSGWQNEMQTDFFDDCNKVFSPGTHYVLSPTVNIPETWERARYIYVPVYDFKENIIGVCGFEINDLYFQLSNKVNDSKLGQLTCALLDEADGVYSGQFNSSRYNTFDSLVNTTDKKGYTIFDFGNEKCVGRTTTVTLGKDTFTAALMLPEPQFRRIINTGQLQTLCIILLVVFFAFVSCLFLGKKFVSPILKTIEQIKSNEEPTIPLNIREINDLFAFLEERDVIYEKKLQSLEEARQLAEEEAQRTKLAYERALAQYSLAQSEIQHLSENYKKDIVLEDYEFFICNLSTLTPTEYKIYELYLDGKDAKEIIKIMGFTENTLKYHNKNIYSKLGISSRKQLLRFATLKQHQDKIGSSEDFKT